MLVMLSFQERDTGRDLPMRFSMGSIRPWSLVASQKARSESFSLGLPSSGVSNTNGISWFLYQQCKAAGSHNAHCNENALKEFRLWEGNSGSGRRAMNVRWCPSSSPPSWTQRTDCPVVFLGLCPWLGHAGHLAGLVASPPSCTFAFSVPKRQHFLRTQYEEYIPAATKRIPALRIMLFLLL